ncbi:MAG: hypothetical protein CXZ00_05225 [Acidobacteria bacterium]|nr:MAG: hypothetical protein CXZ00_05225 [Acidobacteriota bacterium]
MKIKSATLLAFVASGIFCTAGFVAMIGETSCKSTAQKVENETAHAQPNMPADPFQGVQNDNEGYDGHPWGQDITAFKQLNNIYSSCGIGDALQWIEQVPGLKGRSGYVPDSRYKPDIEIAPADTEASSRDNTLLYYFYGQKLAFVVVRMTGDPETTLESKYQRVATASFVNENDGQQGQYRITLFKRGATNTRIYNVSNSHLGHHCLVYMPSSVLYQIGADVKHKIAAVAKADETAKEQEMKQAQAAKQAEERRVQ